MGMPYTGDRVAVIDERGDERLVGVPGDVGLHWLDVHGQPDPIFSLATGGIRAPPSPSSLDPGVASVIWSGVMRMAIFGMRGDQTMCPSRLALA